MGRKKKDWANVSKPPKLKDKMKGVSLGKDDKGYFVYTHRCRSNSYESPENIPDSKIRFIESTGSTAFPLSVRAADEDPKRMPFPARYRKALKKRTKILTLRVHDEQDKYKVGKIYEASTYDGEPWGIKVKVLDIDTVPYKDVRAGYKDLEDLDPDDPVDVIRIEVMKKRKKEAALVSEAQDPIRRTAESMLRIIIFLLFRVAPDKKRRFLQRVRGKLQHLSPADISMKNMPPTASIGQAVGITKNILAGLNPFFVKRVIDELTQMMAAIPADHNLPGAPAGIHPELQPQPPKPPGS